MSHYTTAVFSHSPADMEGQLAPYEETETSEMPKWDWYTICESGFEPLRLKDGSTAYRALVNDIDFSRDEKQYHTILKRWDDLIATGGTDAVKYYKELYGSREAYADMQSCFSPFAFIDADGGWHEQGEMGWFGFSTANNESIRAYLAELAVYIGIAQQLGLWLTLCDCHI